MAHMSQQPDPDVAHQLRAAYTELLARAPESNMQPRLDPMAELCDILGSPQKAYPVIHITGTNGKTSTARMIERLLSEHDLRVGRYTSPHLALVTERIVIDGAPISADAFCRTYDDISPYVAMVDGTLHQQNQPPLTFFEVLTALGYAAFAEAPIDVAVVEVGLGGAWDATNVADAAVAVFTPIGMDHAQWLGDTIEQIASEKVGIIKPDCSVVSAANHPDAEPLITEACAANNAICVRHGTHIGVTERTLAVGGQQISIQGVAATYTDIFLPAHGKHQAENAAVALAATEMFLGRGSKALGGGVVEAAFAELTTPGRLEVVRPSPPLVVDAAHNPVGLETTLEALAEAFNWSVTVALFGTLADKDAEAMLALLEPVADEVVITQSTSPRAIPTEELAGLAEDIFGEDRVHRVPRLDDAIDVAVNLAEAVGGHDGGVIATGSVTVAGEVRVLTRAPAVT